MMIAQQRFGRILVYGRPVDMRNGFDGLEAVVRAGLGEDPLSGDLFVFINAKGNLVKALLWDRTGFIIISKRLERGRFRLRSRLRVFCQPGSRCVLAWACAACM